MTHRDEPLEKVGMTLSELVEGEGFSLRSQMAGNDDLRFEVADQTGEYGAQVLVSRGGALQVILSNGYEFLDFQGDSDETGLARQAILGLNILAHFVAGRYVIEDGWFRKGEYMSMDELGVVGKLRRRAHSD